MNKYFPNLNALRFIAASMVVVFHIELYKSFYNIPNLFHLPFFKIVGKLSVVLFFVLSGFLITTLLLNEYKMHGKINFKNFYLRRAIRIWPLYFLILIIGFFVLPNFSYWEVPNDSFHAPIDDFWKKLFIYILILPNLAVAIYGELTGVSQSWSLGTEEQFYLIWPIIITLFRKKIFYTMIVLLIGYSILLIVFGKLAGMFTLFSIVSQFWNLFNINCMTIGGLFAYIHFNNNMKMNNILFNKFFFIFSLIVLISLLSIGIKFSFFHYEIYSFLFGILIYNLGCNPKLKIVLENRWLNYLGTISFGIYMFHPAIVPPAIKIALFYQMYELIYFITLPLTFLLSALSYEYYEKYFLKFKNKFA